VIRAYCEPESVEETLGLLAEEEESRVMAGGQSLLVLLRQGLAQPSRLVSLHRVAEMSRVEAADVEVLIGAMATYRQIASSPDAAGLRALVEACRLVGPIPVQNAGTAGGSICHNAPGADAPPALLALDAVAEVRSAGGGDHCLPLTDFFRGYFETVLETTDLLVAIRVPKPVPGAVSSYLKFNYRLIDMAMVGVAVSLRHEDGIARDVRIALGGVDAVPFRALAAEAALEGSTLDRPRLAEAGHLAAEDREPISDVHCSGGYRRRVIPVLVRRAFAQALPGLAL
jgi:CO/xanthine dehydrogenase FAD-binding subunit